MQKNVLIVAMVFYFLPLPGMMNKVRLHHARSARDRSGNQIKIDKPVSGIFFENFCPDINYTIIDSMTINSGEIGFTDTCKWINSLAQVNKFLNQYMNHVQRTLTWIRNLSEQFDLANNIAARTLCTSAAKDRYFLQNSAIRGNPSEQSLVEIEIGVGKGLDLNFTYNNHSQYGYKYKMPLLSFFLCCNDKIVNFLVEKGADINSCDNRFGAHVAVQHNEGDNVCMVLLRNRNVDVFESLFRHPQLNIDYQNGYGNTALHVCMGRMPFVSNIVDFTSIDASLYRSLCKVIEILIERKADPTIKNKGGYTALECLRVHKGWNNLHNNPDSPEKTICLEIIQMLQQAEENWKNRD